ncbi:MAG: agmatine deiminase family protein, partial [Sedimenticolaceae bacterium]
MLTWPHANTDWGPNLDNVYQVFAAIGSAIAAGELLLSVCRSTAHAATVGHWLRQGGAPADRLRFCIADSNDTWARDHGPLTTLVDNTPLLNDFVFNGWGGKFDAELDAAITGRLASAG